MLLSAQHLLNEFQSRTWLASSGPRVHPTCAFHGWSFAPFFGYRLHGVGDLAVDGARTAKVSLLVNRYGFHIRDVRLLASALACPPTTVIGAQAYPQLDLKAAAPLES